MKLGVPSALVVLLHIGNDCEENHLYGFLTQLCLRVPAEVFSDS